MQSVNNQQPQSHHQDVVHNFEKNIAAIYRERRTILNALNQKYKERKYLTESQDNSLKLRPSPSQLQDNPRKLVKLSSQKSAQNVNLTEKQSKSDRNNQNQEDQNTKVQKKQQIPQAITDRNKRIFGGLTSYLKKAGQHLKSKQFKEKQRTTKEILNKVINKEKQQRQQVQNKQREELESQIKKLEKQKKEVESRLASNENMMLQEIVRGHLSTLSRFNMTRSEPKVCWKPAKTLEMPEKQDKIHQSTQKYLKKLQQEWLSNIKSYSEVTDHSNYMTQNQRQFYGNLIGKMYKECEGFVLTSAEPQVFWKPKEFSAKMSDLIAETRSVLQQKCQSLKRTNQDFYLSKKQPNPEDDLAKEILDQQNEDFEEINQKPSSS